MGVSVGTLSARKKTVNRNEIDIASKHNFRAYSMHIHRGGSRVNLLGSYEPPFQLVYTLLDLTDTSKLAIAIYCHDNTVQSSLCTKKGWG